MINRWLGICFLLLALAVALGAFGAHGLRDKLSAYSMGVYEKAVFYHFIHALGLGLLVLLTHNGILAAEELTKFGYILTGGIVLFSGSLYALAITDIKILGAITPLGGSAFILCWAWLGISFLRR